MRSMYGAFDLYTETMRCIHWHRDIGTQPQQPKVGKSH